MNPQTILKIKAISSKQTCKSLTTADENNYNSGIYIVCSTEMHVLIGITILT